MAQNFQLVKAQDLTLTFGSQFIHDLFTHAFVAKSPTVVKCLKVCYDKKGTATNLQCAKSRAEMRKI